MKNKFLPIVALSLLAFVFSSCYSARLQQALEEIEALSEKVALVEEDIEA